MNDRYYAKTLEDGKIALYRKSDNKMVNICDNMNFAIAWMCIEEDYDSKLEIIHRIMACEDGIVLDDIEMKNEEGLGEFVRWHNKIRTFDKIAYHSAIDNMYKNAIHRAKTYYAKDFDAQRRRMYL